MTTLKHIVNQTGYITAHIGNITSQQINNHAVSHLGSLIYGDNLSISTQQLDNQETKATGKNLTQGIQGRKLAIQSTILNNQNGGIYSADTAAITASQRINNQQGELLSANAISIKNNGNLMVNNQNGLIQGQNAIDLTAKGLETEGTIKTAGNLSIDLKDSFTLNQAFDVGNNLTFSTQGDFTNNVKQVVGNQAAFTANHILNPAHAEISSNRTLLNTATLTNYGLLDGQENIIKTRTLDNLGTGRIYGDHLAIQADSLNNLNQDEKSATIAARDRLDLGVGTLVNRDHSLIFSLGDMAIGRQLDENNQAKGYAKFIDNGSATLEALGNGDIKTQRLLNHDLYLKLGEYHTDEHIIEYAPANSSKRYALLNKDGSEGRLELKNNDKHDSNSYFILNNGTQIASRYWMSWDYNRHTVTSTIEYRDPANILIGGHLSLSGADLENNASNLSVGKTLLLGNNTFTRNENNNNLTAGGITLKNIDILGTIDIKDTGIWAGFGKEHRRYGVRGKKRWAVYGTGSGEINDVHPTQYFTFDKVLNEIGNEITGTNTQIASQSAVNAIALKTVTSKPTTSEQGNMTISTPSAVISGQVSALHPANLEQNMQPVLKTHLTDIRLPQASLYKINPEAPNGYLVETDPTFTDRKQWLSSDYMFNALRHDHNYVQKRLGDGFYEQRLVNEQINQLTGRRFLDNYSSDFEQYKALMDSGIYYANKFNLSLGVGLTAQQMAELTSDMVWFVNKEVTLPSGKTLTVLTPQVYLVARNLDVTPQGALISAREIVGNINGDIQNSGTIAGQNLTALSAKNIQNHGIVLGKQMNTNGQVTVGYGFSASGSYNQSKMNADYASVVEQSGIYTGGDGYQVNVQNHTDLKGGLITSSQTAEDNGNNHFETGTLSYSDIQNHADYSGSSFGVDVSMTKGGGEKPKEIGGKKLMSFGENKQVTTVKDDGRKTTKVQGITNTKMDVGIGHDSEHKKSITRSGINTDNLKIRDEKGQLAKTGIGAEATINAVKTALTTENAAIHSGKLEKNFDKEKVLKELNIQVNVTKEFRRNAFSAIDEYVLPKQAELREKIKQAKTEEEKTALYDEIYKLQYQKRLLETVVGIVAGSPELAITQGTLQLAATKMREETLANSRKFAGIVDTKTGKVVRNDSYDSGYFDGVKLGGVRIDISIACNSNMGTCTQNKDGTISFTGNDNNTIDDVFNPEKNDAAKSLYGQTGGFQPELGGFYSGGKPIFNYQVGSFWDNLVESFAGTHDLLGGQIWGWYDDKGNTSPKTPVENGLAETTTILALPISTPFAIADLMESDFIEVLSKLRGN